MAQTSSILDPPVKERLIRRLKWEKYLFFTLPKGGTPCQNNVFICKRTKNHIQDVKDVEKKESPPFRLTNSRPLSIRHSTGASPVESRL